MPNLRIAEIFRSVQGEGQLTGMPSTFVRVSGCNLRCVWCDTPYASWRPEGPIQSVEEVFQAIEVAGLRYVVLTGGEPMLFDGIERLCAILSAADYHVTIETAGTIYRDLPCTLMSLSPKMANSMRPDAALPDHWKQRHESVRLNRHPLRQLTQQYAYQLKMVINPDEGLDQQVEELLRLCTDVGVPDFARVMLMPEGTDSATLHRRGRRLVDVCLQYGFRYCPRTHIDLFGDTRGT